MILDKRQKQLICYAKRTIRRAMCNGMETEIRKSEELFELSGDESTLLLNYTMGLQKVICDILNDRFKITLREPKSNRFENLLESEEIL